MFSAIIEWWQGLSGFELILWGIALLFSFLFLAQAVFSFFIGDADHPGIMDDADGLFGNQFFTLKNLITFFTMFGWAGLAAYKSNISNIFVVLIALAAGSSMVYFMYVLMRYSARLRHSGTLQMKNAVNQLGETYLRIPAKRGGMGKVHVQFQGRLTELDAMTDDVEDIATGKQIQVVGIINNRILLVSAHMFF